MERKNTRNQIVWYNAILCILVILIHASNTDVFTEAVPLLNAIEYFVVEKIARAAVGGFFLCSGYLFYRGICWQKIPGKLKNRCFSLLIPYFVWNFIYYIIHYAITKIPVLNQLYSEIVPLNVEEMIQALVFYKYNPVFWYMQYLIVFVILSPVLYGVIKNKWMGSVFLMLVLIIADKGMLTAILPNISHMINWLFLYGLGGFLAYHFTDYIEKKEYNKKGAALTFSAAVVIYILQNYYMSTGVTLLYYLAISGAVWFILSNIKLPDAREWMKSTFFIYAIHFLIVRFITKAAVKILGVSMYAGIGLFFIMPIVVILISEAARKILTGFLPGVWKVLAGNRGIKKEADS